MSRFSNAVDLGKSGRKLMRESVELRRQLRDSINAEIAQRVSAHQAKMARLMTGRANVLAAGAPVPTPPLALLAVGDSWFDYPLDGNDISFENTDIIAQLQAMGTINPAILNLSHHGDATTDEMSLPKQQRMIDALQDPANWLDAGKPDAILFSGGGNDVAGDQFCIFLDFAAPGANGLDAARFNKAIGMVEASYLDLFLFRDRYAPGVPIFAHTYDFPIPNGVHPICAGPWLKPSLDYTGWTDLTQGASIVRQALLDFKALLLRLTANPANNFILIDTQGSLAAADWANELHPFPGGFKKLAGAFVTVLRNNFPGRI
jgi:hypothetical protein